MPDRNTLTHDFLPFLGLPLFRQPAVQSILSSVHLQPGPVSIRVCHQLFEIPIKKIKLTADVLARLPHFREEFCSAI